MAMNYLEKKRQEEQRPAGLQGVSENTRTQQAKYENGYVPSQQTQTAQQNLAAVQQQKPQTYNSKYGAALDNILAQIQNQQDFKYSFDGDEMFKYYADLYTQQAKQGAQNAMGQAVGLTGGYGNSWASAQANQAYQQALLPLFDRGMDLRDRAYQQYLNKQNNLMDQAGLLQSMDATDYGRYRDTVSDYYADVDRAQAAADNERAFDYNNYMNMLDYWQGAAKLENADFRADQDEAFRQAQLEEQIRGTDLDEAYRRDTLGWQQATDARDFAESVRRADQDEDFRNAQFAWQQNTDARDFAENVRRADQDETYRQQAFNEQVRQANLDEDYRNRTFDESVRQANLDEAYRRDSLKQNAEQFAATTAMDWAQLEEKQREFDASLSEDQRQANQKIAIAYVTDILASGQMPSNELLVAAGLSLEDAQKLMAQVQIGGTGGGPAPKTEETPTETEKPMSFLEANQLIFRNTPDNLTLGDTGYKGANQGKTFGEYKQMIQDAVAEREAKNEQTTEDKIKNASWTGAAGVLAAKQETAKKQPTKIEFNEWLKKGAKVK